MSINKVEKLISEINQTHCVYSRDYLEIGKAM